jgi:hypothetical protein
MVFAWHQETAKIRRNLCQNGSGRPSDSSMKHPNSIALLTYWNAKRGERPCPARSDIEPSDIARHLPHVLIAEADGAASWRFRLAGTAICTLAGQELKGLPVGGLWLEDGRRNLGSILRAVAEGAPAVLTVDGLSHGGRVLKAEALFMPLSGPEGAQDRMLGTISVFEPPYWIGADALRGFSTTGFRLFDPSRPNPFLSNRPEVTVPHDESRPQQPHSRPSTRNRFFLIDGGRKD